jgi:transcriptional regulator
MAEKREVQQGTLSLMILRTLDVLGPLHGFGIGGRIEETSRGRFSVNYGTLYPVLLKLEQAGYIKGAWGTSENNRRAKFYAITRAGKRQLAREMREWEETSTIISWFLAPGGST